MRSLTHTKVRTHRGIHKPCGQERGEGIPEKTMFVHMVYGCPLLVRTFVWVSDLISIFCHTLGTTFKIVPVCFLLNTFPRPRNAVQMRYKMFLIINLSVLLRGHVQTTWTEFWAILTPSSLLWTLLLNSCGHLSKPLNCLRGLYIAPNMQANNLTLAVMFSYEL